MELPFLILFLIQCFIIIIPGWIYLINSKSDNNENKELPTVSILVAARNEEKYIYNCVLSLIKQNYPNNKYEILVGNDQSEDNTLQILKELEKEFPILKTFTINKQIGHAIAKANVLAQLALEAKGSILLITDADTEVNPNWIRWHADRQLSGFNMTGGFTIPKTDHSNWTALQSIDWLFYGSMMFGISSISVPCTFIGNNAGISADLYKKTGGYESMGNTIVEDHALCMAGLRNQGKLKLSLDLEALAYTHAIPNVNSLMRQRQRWFSQFFHLHPFWIILLVMGGLWIPFSLLCMFFIYPIWILIALVFIDSLKMIYILMLSGRLKLHYAILPIVIYPIYNFLMLTITPIYTFFIRSREWKGRQYTS